MNIKLMLRFLDRWPSVSGERILKEIDGYSVVSFDVFDTLVKRKCFVPEEVFRNAAIRFNAKYAGTVVDPDQFLRDRCAAAKRAKIQAQEHGVKEVTLDEIYAVLAKQYECSEKLKQCEIHEEVLCCYPNNTIKRVYERCLEQGRRVYIISDMYLSLYTIAEILKNCGIEGYERLFVSSEAKRKKKDGELFRYFLGQCHLEPSECAHIGDSVVSDYLSPRKQGIKGIKISMYPNNAIFCRKGRLNKKYREEYNRLYREINNATDTNWDIYKKFGFECMGPMLYYFSIWLHRELQKDGIEKVFFLSRDGFLIKKVYDELFGQDDSVYLNISRRSIHVPLLHKNDDIQKYLSMNGDNKRWSLKTVCNRLAIEYSKGKAVWDKLDLPENYSFKADDIIGNEKLKDFFEHFHEASVIKSKEEFDLCGAYLRQMGMMGNIAIVDTGGNGTTQTCLELLNQYGAIDAHIKGFYLWSQNVPDERFKVYPCTEYGVVGGETVVCELPLTSDEGTTIKYACQEDGTVVPVKDRFEFENEQEILHIIQEIQDGVMTFAHFMKDMPKVIATPEVAYHNAMMATRHPRRREVEMFGDVYFHSDNEDTYLAKPDSLFSYMVKPKSLMREFKLVRWKVGFLRRLFKIPFPYYEMLKCLKGKTAVKK